MIRIAISVAQHIKSFPFHSLFFHIRCQIKACIHGWLGRPSIWSNHQNGRRCMTPSAPPPTTTHPQWWSDSRVCPSVVEWTICWQFKSQIRLDKVLPSEIIWVWHFFPPSPASLFLGLMGIFLEQRSGVLRWGGGCCWLEMSVSVWTAWRDTQCVWHLLVDKITLGFCLYVRH